MHALINNDKMSLVGKFDSIEAAEKVANAAKYDFTIVSNAQGLNCYSGPDLIKLYNNISSGDLKKFETKAKGLERTWSAIEKADVKVTNPPKKGKASTGRSNTLVDERELQAKPNDKKRWKKETARSRINAFIEKKGKTTVMEVVKWAIGNGTCENRQQVIGCINKLVSHPTQATVVVL